ncbi:fasciclin domain-containing protein [Pararhizobium mangrovi]|nr:fasciclin domain-containing protein [Pararhizobium mangrovi]
MNSDSSMKSDDSAGSGDSVMVGGAPMSPSKTIVENASQANNLTTLVKAVKAAGLVDTLSGDGPFTVFAPTNAAFNKLPDGTVSSLMDNTDKLKKILTYHVVPGDLDAATLMQKIKDGNGSANLTTVEGEPLTAKMDGKKLVIIDKKGGGAVVQTPDVKQSNGVVHVIGAVLMP